MRVTSIVPGKLLALAPERGRATRPEIKLGICGEHGGDPASIAFCEALKFDYVSALHYRVQIAQTGGCAGVNRISPSD